MDIIKQGQIPTERKYQTTCGICKTEFRFAQKEGKIHYGQRDGDCIMINCPLCKKDIYVATESYIRDTNYKGLGQYDKREFN